MFKSESKTTFRVKGLPSKAELTQKAFDKCMRKISDECNSPWTVTISLSEQESRQVATVSTPSRSHKKRLQKFAKDHHRGFRAHYSNDMRHISVDDHFADMTVLQSPADPDIDICVIHGLNGNGFDTFAKSSDNKGEPVAMWPRDFLQQETKDLGRPRVMTFDYNSSLIDPHDHGNINEWAESLLRHLNRLRTPAMRNARPVIFVGYSLGGLVARDVAIELFSRRDEPAHYKTVALEDCGFLFLGTPFHGSSLADYGPLSFATAARSGVRSELALKLKTFSHDLTKARSEWERIQSKDGGRPLYCLCEQRDTRTPLFRSRRIVTQASASWINCKAEEIPKRDHRTICAYASAGEQGYDYIRWALVQLRRKLLGLHEASVPNGSNENDAIQPVQNERPSRAEPSKVPFINDRSRSLDTDPDDSIPGQVTTARYFVIHDTWSKDIFSERMETYKANVYPSPKFIRLKACQKPSNLDVSGLMKKPIDPIHPPQNGNSSDHYSDHRSDNESTNLIKPAFPQPRRSSTEMPSIISTMNKHQGLGGNGDQARPNTGSRSPWQKQTILSIDGGGLRGYSSLLMLQTLMQKIAILEEYHPHETPRSPFGSSERPQSIVSLSNSSRSTTGSSTLSFKSHRRLTLNPRSSSRNFKVVRTPTDKTKPQLYPCHYFDYIVGSGTGALIAIMLGRLRMSINDCLVYYTSLSTTLYQQPTLSGRGFFSRDRHSPRHLRNAVDAMIASHKANYPDRVDNWTSLENPGDLCKTIVVALESESRQTTLLRSYDHLPKDHAQGPVAKQESARNPGAAQKIEIWEAARAATAAPAYFADAKIKGTKFLDGSKGMNNPSREVLWEVLDLHNGDKDAIECMVSVGCGAPKGDRDGELPRVPKAGNGPVERARRAAYESEEEYYAARSLMRYMNKDLYRFNVQASLWKVALTDLETDAKNGYHHNSILEEERRRLTDSQSVRTHLDLCAEHLVAHRRAREVEDQERWLRFADGAFYRCVDDSHLFKLRQQLEDHLRSGTDHTAGWWDSLTPSDRAAFVKRCAMEPRVDGGPM